VRLTSGLNRAGSFVAMTAPRPVFPDSFLFITRSTTQQQFLLKPDEDTNNAFTYCLAEAAKRFELDVVLSQMEANHHHTMAYDAHGRRPQFLEHFHKMLAKTMNALRGRWENLWSSEEPCVVEVMSRSDLLDKLVYIATNPVKDNLVERVHHWPGPNFLKALLTGKGIKACRPKHFFSEHGSMPPEVELVLKLPDHMEGKAEFLAELRARIADVEEKHASERRRTGGRVLGRRRVLRQSWRDSPTSCRSHRGLRPRVAARDIWRRVMTLQRNKEWLAAYRDARADWLAGVSTEFPFGTYWLRRFANVRVKPPPEAN
jgi:putative transposase